MARVSPEIRRTESLVSVRVQPVPCPSLGNCSCRYSSSLIASSSEHMSFSAASTVRFRVSEISVVGLPDARLGELRMA